MLQLQGLLGITNISIGCLEYGKKEIVLAAEIMVEHAFVDTRPQGDAINPRTTQAKLRELGLSRIENARTGAHRIARGGHIGLGVSVHA